MDLSPSAVENASGCSGFVLDYPTLPGSALSETDRQVRAIEKVIAETPDVASYSRRTWLGEVAADLRLAARRFPSA